MAMSDSTPKRRVRTTPKLQASRRRPVGVVISQIEQGLPFARLEQLSERLGVPLGRVSKVARISPRSLARRRNESHLQPQDSDRVVQIDIVFDRAVELFEGDLQAARRWFDSPCRALDDATPLDYCRTAVGAREVEHLIGRLEHGVVV